MIQRPIALGEREQKVRLPTVSCSAYFAFCFFTVILTFTGCNSAPPPKAAKAPRVEATTPITDLVMDYQDFTGRLEAIKSVEIRARVSGYITEIPFKEGDVV